MKTSLASSVLVSLFVSTAPAQTPCTAGWVPTFGCTPGMDGEVRAFVQFDSGQGAELYAGGRFTVAGGLEAARIARWDGHAWRALGSGLTATALPNAPHVNAFAVFDGGSGPVLYVAGEFQFAGGVPVSGVARWNGSSWSAAGSFVPPQGAGVHARIKALAEYDDGNGPALYAGGHIAAASGQPAPGIAKWDGLRWSEVGGGLTMSGTPGDVRALVVFDDGSGPALYAAGSFDQAGGIPAVNVARWNGQSWSALGSGVGAAPIDGVYALAVHDDGSGPALFVGGDFTAAGGTPAARVAKWNGVAWSPLAAGFNGQVTSLAVHDEGAGAQLFAGGSFFSSGGTPVARIARWDGAAWNAVGGGVAAAGVSAIASIDLGEGPRLLAGGNFTSAGGKPAPRIAKFDGEWSTFGGGLAGPLTPGVLALTTHEGELYAGGSFTTAMGAPLTRVGRWDGSAWTPLGMGANASVAALVSCSDGSLVAAGHFTSIDDVLADRVARWDGSEWTAMGSGFDALASAALEHDDGGGLALFVGGEFTMSGAISVPRIARWNGAHWQSVGGGLFGPGEFVGVSDLLVHDDGSGAQLYAAGSITGGVVRWDGTQWSVVGGGISGGVNALVTHDDGSGPALYAGGSFHTAGGQPADRVARWNGTTWTSLGFGAGTGSVRSFASYADTSGRQLIVGGYFHFAGAKPASNLARWDGSEWFAMPGGGTNPGSAGTVQVLHVWHGSDRPTLYVGGHFGASPSGDSLLARYSGCPVSQAVPGCAGNAATLALVSGVPAIGSSVVVGAQGFALPDGIALFYGGLAGTDGQGCGFVLPGLGEILLAFAPAPAVFADGFVTAGTATMTLPISSNPGWIGLPLALQAVHVSFAPGLPIELSQALVVHVTP